MRTTSQRKSSRSSAISFWSTSAPGRCGSRRCRRRGTRRSTAGRGHVELQHVGAASRTRPRRSRCTTAGPRGSSGEEMSASPVDQLEEPHGGVEPVQQHDRDVVLLDPPLEHRLRLLGGERHGRRAESRSVLKVLLPLPELREERHRLAEEGRADAGSTSGRTSLRHASPAASSRGARAGSSPPPGRAARACRGSRRSGRRRPSPSPFAARLGVDQPEHLARAVLEVAEVLGVRGAGRDAGRLLAARDAREQKSHLSTFLSAG